MVLIRVGQPQFTRAGDITRTRDKSQGRIKDKIYQLGRIFLGPKVERTRERSSPQETMNTLSVVKFNVVHPVPSASGHSQKNEISPGAAECQSKQIKICERCFLCHSIVLCKTCNKCSQCCHKSTCRGKTPELLENLVGSRGRSEGSSNPLGGVHPPLPDPAELIKKPHSYKLLWQSSQESLPVRGITSAYGQKRNRTGTQTKLPRVFQPAIFSPKTQQQVEAYSRLKQSEPLPQGGKIQDGDTGNYQDIPPTVQEISEVSRKRADLSIQSSAFRTVHSTLRVHCDSKGGTADGHTQGYKNPPVPRQLVGEGNIPPGLSPAYTSTSRNVPETGMASERRKVGIGAQAGFQLCRLPVRPSVRSGPTNTGPVAKPSRQNTGASNSTGLSSPRVHVIDRPVNSHRKTGSPRPTTHETHSVASQKQLEGTGISGEVHSTTQVIAPTLALVASRKQCSNGSTFTPGKTCSAYLYRRIKRRVGRSLKRAHCKRNLVPPGKQAAHKLLTTQSRVSSFKTLPGPLLRQDSPGGNRQHHSSVLHKQGSRHEVGPIMCPSLEDLDLVFQKSSDFEGPTYSRPAKHGSGQTIPARPSHTDRMVPPSRDFRIDMQQVALTSNRSFRHEVQQQAPLVCVTRSRPIGHCSGCTQPAMGESGRICLPTNSHFGQSGGEVAGLPVPKNDSDCPRVAQHALVLGPSGNVRSLTGISQASISMLGS